MIFVFWELVGFSSYMLIGHYMTKGVAVAAQKKAFIVNRIGDLGFVIGIAYAYWHFGTTDLEVMGALVGANPDLISMGIAALLMCGFIGKSAQFPLHVWLPDAMAGPTPVSALIHAATMVAAGGYFLIRIVYLFPEGLLTFIAWLGVFGAVYAGFCAYARSDIKQILAYSTLSQLGYIAAAFGLGYPGIALFHLITHAFFKALLFLSAGSSDPRLPPRAGYFQDGWAL
jgi:NADH-quinone oxidoreductase subunit L